MSSFGEEIPAFEQHSTIWSVAPYEADEPLSKTPKTYVSFIFRYRTRGKSLELGLWLPWLKQSGRISGSAGYHSRVDQSAPSDTTNTQNSQLANYLDANSS